MRPRPREARGEMAEELGKPMIHGTGIILPQAHGACKEEESKEWRVKSGGER